MSSADRVADVEALSEIQAHLRKEETEVARNGLYDLVQRVILAVLGTILTMAFGLSKCQNIFRAGVESIRGPSSGPPIVLNSPRPLVSTSSHSGVLQ